MNSPVSVKKEKVLQMLASLTQQSRITILEEAKELKQLRKVKLDRR